MGQPPGITQAQVEERHRKQYRVKDTASYVCAGLISNALSDEESRVYALMDTFSLSEQEVKAVIKEMKAIRKRIDPHGDWT